jgi:hypothetical protein
VKASGIPKGYTCGCGFFNAFHPYVFAHWRIQLVHACEGCGRRHAIEGGAAEEIVPLRTLKKA